MCCIIHFIMVHVYEAKKNSICFETIHYLKKIIIIIHFLINKNFTLMVLTNSNVLKKQLV